MGNAYVRTNSRLTLTNGRALRGTQGGSMPRTDSCIVLKRALPKTYCKCMSRMRCSSIQVMLSSVPPGYANELHARNSLRRRRLTVQRARSAADEQLWIRSENSAFTFAPAYTQGKVR